MDLRVNLAIRNPRRQDIIISSLKRSVLGRNAANKPRRDFLPEDAGA